jgi:hypothetical protein
LFGPVAKRKSSLFLEQGKGNIALASIGSTLKNKQTKVVGRRTVERFNLSTEEGEGWARD